MDQQCIDDCHRAYQKTDEVINASSHLKSCSLDGGVDVKLGKIIPFPGYNDDAHEDLVDNLLRAIDWSFSVGFVPYFFRNKNRPLRARPIKQEQGNTDAMDIDVEEPDPINELDAEDLKFYVPSLGHGTYQSYKDRETCLRKIEYIRSREDKEDGDTFWFVYTCEEPIIDVQDSEDVRYPSMARGLVNSPVARLLPDIEAMRQFRKEDRFANKVATMPPYIIEHLPPAKESAQLTTGQLHNDGRNTAPGSFGRTRQATVYSPNPDGSVSGTDKDGTTFQIPMDIARIMTREIKIQDGYTYSGLFTPHAYTRISERHNDFVSRVSIAFGVPAHVILAGKIAKSSSSSMAGARAGGKEPQATGSKAAESGSEEKKGSGGFNADPSFNRALKLRDFLQSFFKSVMYTKNGHRLRYAAHMGIDKYSKETEMTKRLVAELDELIEKAQNAVLNFGGSIETNLQQQEQLRQNDMANQLNVTDPEMVAKVNEAATKPSPPKPAGATGSGGGGSSKPPSVGNLSIPETKLDAPSDGIPVPMEVEALNKRRLELVASLQSISEAVKLREQIASEDCPISLVYRQPIINDTSQIQSIINSLGLPQDRAFSIAQRRYGLLS